jgi:hypothetical protein
MLVFASSALWSYRVRAAAEEAQKFAPIQVAPTVLPAGTRIKAVLWDTIAASAASGDRVTASVAMPVIVKGKLLIPPEALLKGALNEVSVLRTQARVGIDFTLLVIGESEFPIQTRTVVAVAPVQTDIEVLLSGFRTLMGAMLGAAVGAGSEDWHVIEMGIVAGGQPSDNGTSGIPMTVVLA